MSTTSQTPLHYMDLSKFVMGRLSQIGITTLEELAETPYSRLIEIMGARGLLRVDKYLFESGKGGVKDAPKVLTKTSIEEDIRELRGGKTQPAGRLKRTNVDEPDYVQIMVIRGYQCRACEGITQVKEGERPKGIEVGGFTWNDDLRGSSVPPYFVCTDCASHVEIVGKLMATLMGSSAL